jgi:hypothetical protein
MVSGRRVRVAMSQRMYLIPLYANKRKARGRGGEILRSKILNTFRLLSALASPVREGGDSVS